MRFERHSMSSSLSKMVRGKWVRARSGAGLSLHMCASAGQRGGQMGEGPGGREQETDEGAMPTV